MSEQKTIGVLFIDRFADWEYGLLAASAVEWFGARAVSLAPNGKPVTSASGFTLTPDRSTAVDENTDLDAVAVIGSDQWVDAPPNVSALLTAVAARGGVVGGICAGTLALARAGLFGNAKHTSNGRDWINEKEPGSGRPELSGRALCRRRRSHRVRAGFGSRHLRSCLFEDALSPEKQRSR